MDLSGLKPAVKEQSQRLSRRLKPMWQQGWLVPAPVLRIGQRIPNGLQAGVLVIDPLASFPSAFCIKARLELADGVRGWPPGCALELPIWDQLRRQRNRQPSWPVDRARCGSDPIFRLARVTCRDAICQLDQRAGL
jgi:hypothetical protein